MESLAASAIPGVSLSVRATGMPGFAGSMASDVSFTLPTLAAGAAAGLAAPPFAAPPLAARPPFAAVPPPLDTAPPAALGAAAGLATPPLTAPPLAAAPAARAAGAAALPPLAAQPVDAGVACTSFGGDGTAYLCEWPRQQRGRITTSTRWSG